MIQISVRCVARQKHDVDWSCADYRALRYGVHAIERRSMVYLL